MKKILVPTDFSGNANKALDYAVRLASHADAEVMILHASQMHDTSVAFPVNLNYVPYTGDGKEISAQLDRIMKERASGSNVKISAHVYAGFVLESILQASDDLHADLIVMGTLGSSGISEKLFGSVTASVIGRSAIPVLIIPLMAEWSTPEKLLLAMSDFEEKPGKIEMLIQIADIFRSEIKMVAWINDQKSEAAEYIDKARGVTFYEDKLNHHFPTHNVKARVIYGKKLEDSLDSFIRENSINMLAMVTHKRSFLESLFHRSITKKISYHTDIPLLALPA